MAKTSCFALRIVAAMSWVASCCAPRASADPSKWGRAFARPPLTPSTHSVPGDYVTSDGVRSPSLRTAERHGHEPGRVAHLHAHQNGVLALGLGLFERTAHV